MSGGEFALSTSKRLEFIDITDRLGKAIAVPGRRDALCFVFNPHTTAGLTINEGADPAVRADILAVLPRIIPRDYPYEHLEGNSPAHLMASLMGSSVTVIVEQGRLRLGTWQKIYFCEFDGPRTRKLFWRLT
ncbi:MAG: secondary thiamine-phosphate synthase enzyme YjbQ [Desulfurivibrionaceae bacterium]|nr:secondary thiamine-phosphate synthase enzyme YjbQ [Desulfurivibrionaceae bacterium]